MTKWLMNCSLLVALVLSISTAQAQTHASQSKDTNNKNNKSNLRAGEIDLTRLLAQARTTKRTGFSLMPASHLPQQTQAAIVNLVVLGGGTTGRVAKWTGSTLLNSFIGDSNIFEDNTGKVGVGTTSPASLLTVAGMIQTTLGGIKFPDGTVQTTASSFQSVFHDATLTGNGTPGTPLGVAIPLTLTGSAPPAILTLLHTGVEGGDGLVARAGPISTGLPGVGVRATGGASNELGGAGVFATGGASGLFGGDGVTAVGGEARFGGAAISARGGRSGSSNGGHGVVATGGEGNGPGNSSGSGIVATPGIPTNAATNGLAGEFTGDVEISGNLSVSGLKNFKIDHPVDPENKYLYHAAIESSEVLNIYSGNVTTDGDGNAVVTMPDWFEALNKDFRYQLTVVGTFAQAIIADKIKGNRFGIRTNAPNIEVSWQVTGVRSDAATLRRPLNVEVEKPERERGHFLNPEVFNQPEERGVAWARNPQIMQQLKQRRVEAQQMQKQKTNEH